MPLSYALILALTAGASAEQRFNAHWHDGKAELDAYRLVQPRYGAERSGEAVMIWVLEPFSKSKTVKLDAPGSKDADAVRVMKLNHLRTFLTGIYRYDLMTSTFSPAVFGEVKSEARQPLKIAFSSQEWCGTVFHQLVRKGAGWQSTWNSYFESEGDGSSFLPEVEGLRFDDDLWWQLRELVRPLPSGEHPYAPSLAAVRLAHSPLVVGTVRVKRAKAPETITVPLGEFETQRFELELTWGERAQRRTVWVERAWPRRIVAWEGEVASFRGNEPSVERGELIGSMRDTYWQHNGPGDEALRRNLGLPVR